MLVVLEMIVVVAAAVVAVAAFVVVAAAGVVAAVAGVVAADVAVVVAAVVVDVFDFEPLLSFSADVVHSIQGLVLGKQDDLADAFVGLVFEGVVVVAAAFDYYCLDLAQETVYFVVDSGVLDGIQNEVGKARFSGGILVAGKIQILV